MVKIKGKHIDDYLKNSSAFKFLEGKQTKNGKTHTYKN